MDEFILLHLSDLHINREFPVLRESPSEPSIFEEVVNFVNRPKYNDKIDAILISGDLANSGNIIDDLLGAANFVHNSVVDTRKYARNSASLSQTGLPVFIVPGNHDRFNSDAYTCLPGNHAFDLFFPNHWDEGDYFKVNHLYSSASPRLSIISADFTLVLDDKIEIVPGGHYGQGLVCRDRLDRLIDLTIRERDNNPDSCIIWLIHFAPLTQSAFDGKILNRFDKFLANHIGARPRLQPFFLKLVREERLIKAAKLHQIGLICCGHTHINKTYQLPNTNKTKVVCASASTVHEPEEDMPAKIHLRKIISYKNKKVDVSHIDFVWNGSEFFRNGN